MTYIKIIYERSVHNGLINAGKIFYLFLFLFIASLISNPARFDDLVLLQGFTIITILIELANLIYNVFMAPCYNQFDFGRIFIKRNEIYQLLLWIFLILNIVLYLGFFLPDHIYEYLASPKGYYEEIFGLVAILTTITTISISVVHVRIMVLMYGDRTIGRDD